MLAEGAAESPVLAEGAAEVPALEPPSKKQKLPPTTLFYVMQIQEVGSNISTAMFQVGGRAPPMGALVSFIYGGHIGDGRAQSRNPAKRHKAIFQFVNQDQRYFTAHVFDDAKGRTYRWDRSARMRIIAVGGEAEYKDPPPGTRLEYDDDGNVMKVLSGYTGGTYFVNPIYRTLSRAFRDNLVPAAEVFKRFVTPPPKATNILEGFR